MTTNKSVVEYLKDCGYKAATSENVAGFLIEGGFIEADPLSRAEDLADRAKKWLGALNSQSGAVNAFEMASGWSTESWRIVANNSYENHTDYPFSNPTEIKLIFKALCILAVEAGIDYMEL